MTKKVIAIAGLTLGVSALAITAGMVGLFGYLLSDPFDIEGDFWEVDEDEILS